MKAEIPKKEAEPSEEEVVAGWIAELDARIKELQAQLKFSSRHGGAGAREMSEEIKALQLIRKEYEDLLRTAKNQKP